jgi:hypothetical protein
MSGQSSSSTGGNIATLLNVARSQYRRMPVSELSEDMQRKIRESQPQH